MLSVGDGCVGIELFNRAFDFDARFFFGAFFFTDFAFVFFFTAEERCFLTFSVSLPIRINKLSIFFLVFDIIALPISPPATKWLAGLLLKSSFASTLPNNFFCKRSP